MSNNFEPPSAPNPPQPPTGQPGAPVGNYPLAGAAAPAPPSGSNGLAIAGFVLGLLALLGSWVPVLNMLAIPLGLLGIVLAAVGLVKAKKVNAGKGLAIAGIVTGLLAIIVAIIVNVAFVGAVNDAVDEATDTSVTAPDPNSDGGDGADDTGDEDGGSTNSDVGASRDNPAPLGSAISGGDWTVTINSVKTIAQDSLGQTAAKGSVLLLVNMTADYNGNDEQGATPWATISFVSADGKSIDSTDGSTFFVAEKEFDGRTDVYEGGSVTGDRIIEVPADSWQKGVLAVSPDILSDDTFIAVQ